MKLVVPCSAELASTLKVRKPATLSGFLDWRIVWLSDRCEAQVSGDASPIWVS